MKFANDDDVYKGVFRSPCVNHRLIHQKKKTFIKACLMMSFAQITNHHHHYNNWVHYLVGLRRRRGMDPILNCHFWRKRKWVIWTRPLNFIFFFWLDAISIHAHFNSIVTVLVWYEQDETFEFECFRNDSKWFEMFIQRRGYGSIHFIRPIFFCNNKDHFVTTTIIIIIIILMINIMII